MFITAFYQIYFYRTTSFLFQACLALPDLTSPHRAISHLTCHAKPRPTPSYLTVPHHACLTTPHRA